MRTVANSGRCSERILSGKTRGKTKPSTGAFVNGRTSRHAAVTRAYRMRAKRRGEGS